MKLFILLLLLSLSFSQNDTEKKSVKKVIEQLFTAMNSSDSTLLKQSFSSDAIAYTTFIGRDGKPHLKSSDLNGFYKQIGSSEAGSLEEKILSWDIKIDGTLASVWTDYKFYFNGKFSHCGVNSFQLYKSDKGWKIIYLIDTRRRTSCE